MSTAQVPSVELIQGPPAVDVGSPPKRQRWKVFVLTLAVSAVIGIAFVYARSPVYRASVSVVVAKPKAVDRSSAAADLEHVAIQTRLLLGNQLISRLRENLVGVVLNEIPDDESLRSLLHVAPVPETNLLELIAEGAEPSDLQSIVNRWAETYEQFRLEEIDKATARTNEEINDEQSRLTEEIELSRADLAAYREQHDIVSLEREENRILSSLRGLNKSLNSAREGVIEARAELEAANEAIARGDVVVPSAQKSQITRMTLDVERTRKRLADIQEQFTEKYMERDPELAKLPLVLEEKETELARAIELGKISVQNQAQQKLDAGQRKVKTLEAELDARQGKVQQFTEHFKTFKAMEAELKLKETLYADNQQRLTEIRIRNQQKFPPIQVVEPAALPVKPISPNYQRDLLIALGVAFGLALFATWLFDYLTERPRQSASPQPYVGVRVYTGEQGQVLAAANPNQQLIDAGRQSSPPALDSPPVGQLPRELDTEDLQAILGALEADCRGYGVLLLSGVAPYELALLTAEHFDPTRHIVDIPGASPRAISLGQTLWPQLAALLDTLDQPKEIPTLAKVEMALHAACSACDVEDPTSVDAIAIWHSYVVYLVRQGIDDVSLQARVGGVPPDVLLALQQFKPPGDSHPLQDETFTHPALTG